MEITTQTALETTGEDLLSANFGVLEGGIPCLAATHSIVSFLTQMKSVFRHQKRGSSYFRGWSACRNIDCWWLAKSLGHHQSDNFKRLTTPVSCFGLSPHFRSCQWRILDLSGAYSPDCMYTSRRERRIPGKHSKHSFYKLFSPRIYGRSRCKERNTQALGVCDS